MVLYKQTARRLVPYARASWLYEFQGDSTVTVSGATFHNRLAGATGMFDAGAELAMSNKFSLNAALSLFTGSKTRGCTIDAGLKYTW